MKQRLVIMTEIIAPYRIPVFNALAARPNIDLHVLFLSETDPSLRQWLVYKQEIQFSYAVLPSLRRRLGKHNLLLSWGVDATLRRARPDLILCGGYNYLASWQAAYWAKKRNISFLLWIESTAADHRRQRAVVEALKRRFLGLCCGFIVPGKSSAQYLRQFGIPAGAIFHAPNAVDNDHFQEGANRARMEGNRLRRQLGLPSRYFLYVGRLVPAKGVFDLLEAYASLEKAVRSTVGLVFVGDGNARVELENRASKITRGNVHFAGFVQKEQLPVYYGLADALVFPTHSDTWGFVVNEAMASSLPVIAVNVAGCTADLVKDGWNGIVVSAKDIAKLSAAMQYLISSDDMRSLMGRRSLEHITAFSPELCADGIARATEAACGGHE